MSNVKKLTEGEKEGGGGGNFLNYNIPINKIDC